jgi:hypothetical protein
MALYPKSKKGKESSQMACGGKKGGSKKGKGGKKGGCKPKC